MSPRYTARQWLMICASTGLLVALGWLDYITGYELGVFVFYSAPVALAAYYVGRGPGIFFSLGSAITWLLADMYAGQRYSSAFYLYWNTAVRFTCFAINAFTLSKIRQTLDEQQRLRGELAASRSEVMALKAPRSVCPCCQAPIPPAAGPGGEPSAAPGHRE